MDKSGVLVVDKTTIGEVIDDYPEENCVENMPSVGETGEIQWIKEWRATYREEHNKLKVLFGLNYEESYTENDKKRLVSVKNYIMKANMM